ncbi:MAG TPA: primosomal protein N' [Pseudomonadota bacterium]|nr:primosomal protein N' [Pseudomonadota bacterium]
MNAPKDTIPSETSEVLLFSDPPLRLCKIAVMSPAPGPYFYRVPDTMDSLPGVGERVLVPLGGQAQVEGVVLESFLGDAAEQALAQSHCRREALRSLNLRLSGAHLPVDLLELLHFVADYYLAPVGETLRLLLPPAEQAKVVLRVKLLPDGVAMAAKLTDVLVPPECADREPLQIDLLRVLGSRRSPTSFVSLERLFSDERLAQTPKTELRAQLFALEKEHWVEIHGDVKTGAEKKSLGKKPALSMSHEDTQHVLTDEQEQALSALLCALHAAQHASPRRTGYKGFLLHGVTGSGKTEVYLRLIQEARRLHKTALVLVPEISLTPQLSARFSSRFPGQVAVLHSALSPSERASAWHRILRGDATIALGPRSAVFAPLKNLGVLIVDEEHDTSFKQHDGVHYHGRDVALWRAAQTGAIAVLGSATPSLEALELSKKGKLTRLILQKRATGALLPQVEIIDLKQHVKAADQALLTAPLLAALRTTLAAGEQAILLLNRRGYASFLLCSCCGHRLECPNCAVSMTLHKGRQILLCHYCDHREKVPKACPLCQQEGLLSLGLGTERLFEQLSVLFPEAKIERLDRDTAGSLVRVLTAMHRREADILVGTQMLAKGHDFPGVTLVGVVLADTGMGLPDFRAGERTFQLLSQVAGRAGRSVRPGRVLIQTYNPEHPAVQCAARHDYDAFAHAELEARHVLQYPPFVRLGLVRLDGEDPYLVAQVAQQLAATLAPKLAELGAQASMLGPAEAPLSRLQGRSRWQFLLRAQKVSTLHTLLRFVLSQKVPGSLRVTADVDPGSTL